MIFELVKSAVPLSGTAFIFLGIPCISLFPVRGDLCPCLLASCIQPHRPPRSPQVPGFPHRARSRALGNTTKPGQSRPLFDEEQLSKRKTVPNQQPNGGFGSGPVRRVVLWSDRHFSEADERSRRRAPNCPAQKISVCSTSRLTTGYALRHHTHPADSHPDRRPVLILIVARHSSSLRRRWRRSTASCRTPTAGFCQRRSAWLRDREARVGFRPCGSRHRSRQSTCHLGRPSELALTCRPLCRAASPQCPGTGRRPRLR